MIVKLRMDAAKTQEELKASRRAMRQKLKEAMLEAGQQAVLPRVRRGAPSVISTALTVKGSTRGAYITTQGRREKDRITGLLNWGGYVTTQLDPKKAEALKTPEGPRARVDQHRRYRGKNFLERDVVASQPRMKEVALPIVMRAFGDLPHEP